MDRSELREITKREALIIELVHALARGDEKQMGYPLEDIITLLRSPIKSKGNKTALECLHDEGHEFIQELLNYLSTK